MDTLRPAHGGTRPRPTSLLRSQILRKHGADLVHRAVARLEQRWPDILCESGRRDHNQIVEDCEWHLNYLDAAMAVGDPDQFHRYAGWLSRFLAPRGVTREMIADSFLSFSEDLQATADDPDAQAHHRLMIDLLAEAANRLKSASASSE